MVSVLWARISCVVRYLLLPIVMCEKFCGGGFDKKFKDMIREYYLFSNFINNGVIITVPNSVVFCLGISDFPHGLSHSSKISCHVTASETVKNWPS